MPRCYLVGREDLQIRDLCRRLSVICKEQKVSQKKLADALGVTQARISQKFHAGDLDLADILKILKTLSVRMVINEEGDIKIEKIERKNEDGSSYPDYIMGNHVTVRNRHCSYDFQI